MGGLHYLRSIVFVRRAKTHLDIRKDKMNIENIKAKESGTLFLEKSDCVDYISIYIIRWATDDTSKY